MAKINLNPIMEKLRGKIGDLVFRRVRQKTVAAMAAGAKLMLVPRSEVGEARKRAGSRMQVVGVRTLDEAIEVLEANGGATVEDRAA